MFTQIGTMFVYNEFVYLVLGSVVDHKGLLWIWCSNLSHNGLESQFDNRILEQYVKTGRVEIMRNLSHYR